MEPMPTTIFKLPSNFPSSPQPASPLFMPVGGFFVGRFGLLVSGFKLCLLEG